jgi:hypothetical protein
MNTKTHHQTALLFFKEITTPNASQQPIFEPRQTSIWSEDQFTIIVKCTHPQFGVRNYDRIILFADGTWRFVTV